MTICLNFILIDFISTLFRNHPLILGENNSNLTRIVKIIAEAIANDVFEQYPEVAGRIKTILSQVQVSVFLKSY